MIFLDDIDWYKNMVESKRKIVNKTEANKLSQICFTTPCILQCLNEVQMHTPSINFLDASVFPLNSILRAKQIKFKHHCCVDCWAPIHIKTPQCSSVCPFSLFMRGALLQYLTDPLETGFNIYNCTDVIMVFISILYMYLLQVTQYHWIYVLCGVTTNTSGSHFHWLMASSEMC